jgi:opacity protein-like surface antigen
VPGARILDTSRGRTGVQTNGQLPATSQPPSTSSRITGFAKGETKWVATVGGGMELAPTNRWSAKAQYVRYDLGSITFRSAVQIDVDTRGNLARIGMNFYFNPMVGVAGVNSQCWEECARS